MENGKIKVACSTAKFHAKIATRGFLRTVCGAAIASLIALSIYGFVSVTNESGWVAVFDFVTSCATLLVALSNMYLFGGRKRGQKHG